MQASVGSKWKAVASRHQTRCSTCKSSRQAAFDERRWPPPRNSVECELSRSRGYVSDSEHPLFTSPNTHCPRSGSGRLDRPYPGRLLLGRELWHTFLLSSGSEPG